MVRGYDPSANDPVKHLFDGMFRLFKRKGMRQDEAKELIQGWYQDKQWDENFDMWKREGRVPPKIRLTKGCGKKHQYFPAYRQNDEIVVCLNLINNPIELKENVDRQVRLAYLEGKTSPIEDQTQMKYLYDSCKVQYNNYRGMSDELKDTLSRKCAKYLFFDRYPNKYPIDSQFRLSTLLIDEIRV